MSEATFGLGICFGALVANFLRMTSPAAPIAIPDSAGRSAKRGLPLAQAMFLSQEHSHFVRDARHLRGSLGLLWQASKRHLALRDAISTPMQFH